MASVLVRMWNEYGEVAVGALRVLSDFCYRFRLIDIGSNAARLLILGPPPRQRQKIAPVRLATACSHRRPRSTPVSSLEEFKQTSRPTSWPASAPSSRPPRATR